MSDMEQKMQDQIEGGLIKQQQTRLNKIIINPKDHSIQWYERLKRYLTANDWDWQEIL